MSDNFYRFPPLFRYYLLPILLVVIFGSTPIYASFDARSLDFFPNKGQWAKEVLFKAEIPSGSWFLEPNGYTIIRYDAAKLRLIHEQKLKQNGPLDYASNDSVRMHALKIRWLASQNNVTYEGEGKTNHYRNYFLGNNSDTWAGGVHGFKTITGKDLYPGVSIDYYSSGQLPKYDLAVKAGYDPGQIRFVVEGCDRLSLQKGRLRMETPLGVVEEEAPIAWQVDGDIRKEIPCAFELRGNIVSFVFPKGYNRNQPLWIDPLLIFSTYTGSASDNWGFTAAADAAGNAYVGGNVFGPAYVTLAGSFQVSFGGFIDIAISKFDSAGTQLLYSTYLGGLFAENPSSMIVNAQNELIVMGSTSSPNFPVTQGAYDVTFNGTGPSDTILGGVLYTNGVDLIITKFDASGTQLIGSTFYGGSGRDGANRSRYTSNIRQLVYNYGDEFRGEVNLDAMGNIYLASTTTSTDIPITGFNSGTTGQDALIAKFSPNLTQLIWSAKIGGTLDDAAYSLLIDPQNRVYFTGGTGGSTSIFLTNNFPVTPNAFRLTPGGRVDGYVARLSANGQTLETSTYLGTNQYDQCYFIQQDSGGRIFVMGQTEGSYPITPGLVSNAQSGQFVHCLSAALDTGIFSFVIGNAQNRPNFVPTAFLVNECNLIFMSGWGGNTGGNIYPYVSGGGSIVNMPIPRATQPTTDGRDFYLMIISRDASQVLFGTYLGGNQSNLSSGEHVDGGTSRFDKNGTVYQAVCAGCGGNSTFPTTPGVWSNTNNSTNCNLAAFKFSLNFLKAQFSTPPPLGDPATGCVPLTINFLNQSIGGQTYEWFFGDGGFSASTNPTYTYQDTGLFTVTLVARDPAVCTFSDTNTRLVRVLPLPNPTVSPPQVLCINDTVQLQATGGTSYLWTPNFRIDNNTSPTPRVYPVTNVTYTVRITNAEGCSVSRAVPISIRSDVTINFDAEPRRAYVPFNTQFNNLTTDATSFLWRFGTGDTSILRSPAYTYTKAGRYTVILQGQLSSSSCVGRDSLVIEAFDFLIPNVVTPNGDGQNDTFAFEAALSTFEIKLYNRWGRVVYENDRYDYSWNGRNEPGGVYYYYLFEKERQLEFKGWVQLIK
jgi:gliding motility-associated-like protein